MTPDLIFRNRQADPEDLALTFVETELGRHDWRNNWQAAKARGNLRERIEEWLRTMGATHEPEELIRIVDDLVVNRPGRWR